MMVEVLPVTELMIRLYEKPLNVERFHAYLALLQGNTKGDMALPISGFNPMAKEHVLEKLLELKALKAEEVMQEVLQQVNSTAKVRQDETPFKVALNLSDDLKGGWTNRYISDYDSKFKINALVNRHFCTPVFWTSEEYDADMIRQRTLEYVYRTVYWQQQQKPVNLEEHMRQEAYVATQTGNRAGAPISRASINFYNAHKHSDSYDLIFNFLYGDAASRSLEFPCYGIEEDFAGFKLAKASVFLPG